MIKMIMLCSIYGYIISKGGFYEVQIKKGKLESLPSGTQHNAKLGLAIDIVVMQFL